MSIFMQHRHAEAAGGDNDIWGQARRQVAASQASKAAASSEAPSGVVELMDLIGSTRVFLGTSAALEDRELLKECDVVAVVKVGVSPRPCKADVKLRHSITLGDLSSAPVLKHLPKAFEFIDSALKEGSVLVVSEEEDGSEAGAATVVVGWLMARQSVPWSDAPAVVKADRPSALLNKNLEKQLRVWSRWPEFPSMPDWVTDGF